VNGKLKVLVHLDLEAATARISVRGVVTARNVLALYALAKRTNAIAPGLDIALDLTAASARPDALDQLRQCAAAGHLPASVDPGQSDCRLRVLARESAIDAPARELLAA
jgi:hypothetical protein